MLKVTSEGCGDNLIIVAGGPGLSSGTMKSLSPLNTHFKLHFIDFPGTNNNPYCETDFWSLCKELREIMNTMNGKKVILGHSYGGFFASATAAISNVDGVICLSAPLSEKSMKNANINYKNKMTLKLRDSELAWTSNRTDKSFNEWLASYGEMYFLKNMEEVGAQIIREDLSSSQFFLDHNRDIEFNSEVKDMIAQKQIPKLFLAGEDDGIISCKIMKEEARDAGFDFEIIQGSNHFVMIDSPGAVCD